MKVIFMGTPDFAVPVLKALTESAHEVVAVVTKPDEEKGRGKVLSFSPVKVFALEKGIPVLQPEKLAKKEVISELESIDADVIVVAAYGKILRKRVLEMKRFGCVNVHASLLPSYRGAAPIQWAVLSGEKKSGVTIMQMDEGLDTGDILSSEEVLLDAKETSGSLFEKLAAIGGPLLVQTLDKLEQGRIEAVKQGETDTPYACMLEKTMGEVDFSRTAVEAERWIRGMNPWPSAYTYLNGKQIKIWDADVVPGSSNALPGTVVEVTKHDFTVAFREDALRINELQPEGKKRMTADAFLRGYALMPGMTFGREGSRE